MNIPTTIPFKDKVLKLIRKMPEHSIGINGLDLPFWENKLNSEVVLKKDGILFFCTVISDAEIISESVLGDLKIYDGEKIEKENTLFIQI